MRPLTIVTGATRGLGAAVARDLAGRGHHVLFTGRDAGAVRALADEARRSGHEASSHPLDVTSDESLRALVGFVADRQVEVLIDNAAIALNGFDATVAQRTIDTNYHGAVRVVDALVPRLVPGARVVMVSSGMGQVSCLSPALQRRFLDPELDRAKLDALVASFVHDVADGTHARRGWPTSASSVSKVALHGITRVLARELPTARVNAVSPGWVRTDMGGRSAPRSLDEGTRSIVWAALLGADGPTGGFFEDGVSLAW